MKKEIEAKEAEFDPRCEPPGGKTCVECKDLNSSKDPLKILRVPTKDGMYSSYHPGLWTSMSPRCFVYGDGIHGIKREAAKQLSFKDWMKYIPMRDELEYEGGYDWTKAAPPEDASGSNRAAEAIPAETCRRGTRWNEARDLQTTMYCNGKRREHNSAAKLCV